MGTSFENYILHILLVVDYCLDPPIGSAQTKVASTPTPARAGVVRKPALNPLAWYARRRDAPDLALAPPVAP